MHKLGWVFLLSAFTVGSFAPISQAQPSTEEANDNQEDVVDLNTVTCRDLLLTDEEDRTYAFLFMYGYVNGTKADKTINGPVLADASDKVMTACVDNPDSDAFSVFEANL